MAGSGRARVHLRGKSLLDNAGGRCFIGTSLDESGNKSAFDVAASFLEFPFYLVRCRRVVVGVLVRVEAGAERRETHSKNIYLSPHRPGMVWLFVP